MAKRKNRGTASGIRAKVEALMLPQPRTKEERARVKELKRGPKLDSTQLQNQLNRTGTTIPSGKQPKGNRAKRKTDAIKDQL